MSKNKPESAFVEFTLLTGDKQALRPELIGGVTIFQANAEVVLTNLQTAFRVSCEEGHRLMALLRETTSKPIAMTSIPSTR